MSFSEVAQKKRRFAELAERAYTTGRCLFTPFMAMDEVDLLLQCKSDVEYAGLTLFGRVRTGNGPFRRQRGAFSHLLY